MTQNYQNAVLLSIQRGKVQSYGTENPSNPLEREWASAIDKTKVEGPIYISQTGLDGDEQEDHKNHGGPDKAILAYPAEHYERWEEELPQYDWRHGGFGENLTITLLNEHLVCIGDIYQIGQVSLQVSQPRQPCHKLALRWKIKDLPKQIHENNRSGWYFRVLQEGHIDAGQAFELRERHSQWTVAEVNYIIRHVGDDFDRAEQLYACEELSNVLRQFLRKTIDKHRPKTTLIHKIKNTFKKSFKR